jgi:EAL domain-containing protein (putative c-di-GMP-specific phosphodiesterase class I)
LLASKRGGKNRVSGGVRPAHETGRRAEVKAWLRSDHIGVAAQPIVVTATGATVGYEFLARSPTAERQSPLTMFRMAMEEGLMSAVDEHVFTRMVAATSRLPEPGRCHVNLYPSTLLSLSPGRIREIVAAASPSASPLVVELSEQQVIGDPADLLENLRCLREAGVLIALDDVGAGRTSLETLVVLEPEIVKLDARMIRSIDTNKTRMRWLQRIVDVAHRVGATTVAEGVETYGEMRVVETLNVQMCQGYFTGRPELLPQAA